MNKIFNSEYQDVYRIKDGVLFLVNKFEYDKELYPYGIHYSDCAPYKKSNYLKVLKKDFYRKIILAKEEYFIPKETVLEGCRPIKITSKDKWRYEIKTTGDLFSGESREMLDYFSEIQEIINSL